MARILSFLFYALAAVMLLAVIKVPALLMMAGFFAFIGYVIQNGAAGESGDFGSQDSDDLRPIATEEEESILSQKALGYGFYGSLEQIKGSD